MKCDWALAQSTATAARTLIEPRRLAIEELR
jgi:hypothetical protein